MEMKSKVLIVDDDQAVLDILEKTVIAADMLADTSLSAEEALGKLQKETYDVILMDINMPGIDGFQAILKVRELGITTPIMIVRGRKEDADTLYGLDIGADDYITKPFNPVTIGAKIKALIRLSRSRSGNNANTVIQSGPFSFDTSSLRFYKNGEEILLTSKESAMMKLLLDNPKRIFTKDMLYEMVWGDILTDENAVMVYINRLRQKVEDDPAEPRYIQTVRGLGYKFVV